MKTVLIVDDEYLIAEILGFALEDEGYAIEKASNGQKALEVLKRVQVQLVITDYMMPVLNGQELVRAAGHPHERRPGQRGMPDIIRGSVRQAIRHGRDDCDRAWPTEGLRLWAHPCSPLE